MADVEYKKMYGKVFERYIIEYLSKHTHGDFRDTDEIEDEVIKAHYQDADIDIIQKKHGETFGLFEKDDFIVHKVNDGYIYDNEDKFLHLPEFHKGIKTLSYEVKSQDKALESGHVPNKYFFETVANNEFNRVTKSYDVINGKTGGAMRSKADFLVFINFDEKYLNTYDPKYLPETFLIVHAPSLQQLIKETLTKLAGDKVIAMLKNLPFPENLDLERPAQDKRTYGVDFTESDLIAWAGIYNVIPYIKCRFDNDIDLQKIVETAKSELI